MALKAKQGGLTADVSHSTISSVVYPVQPYKTGLRSCNSQRGKATDMTTFLSPHLKKHKTLVKPAVTDFLSGRGFEIQAK